MSKSGQLFGFRAKIRSYLVRSFSFYDKARPASHGVARKRLPDEEQQVPGMGRKCGLPQRWLLDAEQV